MKLIRHECPFVIPKGWRLLRVGQWPKQCIDRVPRPKGHGGRWEPVPYKWIVPVQAGEFVIRRITKLQPLEDKGIDPSFYKAPKGAGKLGGFAVKDGKVRVFSGKNAAKSARKFIKGNVVSENRS